MSDDKPDSSRDTRPIETASILSSVLPLGKILAEARERRGASQSDASREASIPAYYIRMIEDEDFSAIADQIYLLPFLRRYATFLALDPEAVASRFVSEVQRSDMNATRMSEPIAMIEHGSRQIPRMVLIGVAALVLLLLGWIGLRHFFGARSGAPAAAPSSAPSEAPSLNATPAPRASATSHPPSLNRPRPPLPPANSEEE